MAIFTGIRFDGPLSVSSIAIGLDGLSARHWVSHSFYLGREESIKRNASGRGTIILHLPLKIEELCCGNMYLIPVPTFRRIEEYHAGNKISVIIADTSMQRRTQLALYPVKVAQHCRSARFIWK